MQDQPKPKRGRPPYLTPAEKREIDIHIRVNQVEWQAYQDRGGPEGFREYLKEAR